MRLSPRALTVVLAAASLAGAAVPQPERKPDERSPLKYGQPDRAFMERLRNWEVGNTIVVCAGSPIPPGYVIVSRTTNFDCGNNVNNAYVIKPPDAIEVVCAYSPMPPGYVVTGNTTNFQCSGEVNNARIIRRA
ncbi:MAG TPA: hypothetical protein VGA73_04425 [Candidatus Binatia bacterium]